MKRIVTLILTMMTLPVLGAFAQSGEADTKLNKKNRW